MDVEAWVVAKGSFRNSVLNRALYAAHGEFQHHCSIRNLTRIHDYIVIVISFNLFWVEI